MGVEKDSPCKVNLILNILGKRADGFHELETVMHPVAWHDRLSFDQAPQAITLTCSDPSLPTDNRNLVFRATQSFLETAGIKEGIKIHLEKRIPLAAGLGGGSGNAAVTLLALNELFGGPIGPDQLQNVAAGIGSDVPFFLQSGPALGTGRGEQIKQLAPFRALESAAFVLIHPGFGIATAWAYQQLANFPEALHGQRGRAQDLIAAFGQPNLREAGKQLYNSLEAPALKKFPILKLFQDFLRSNGASACLMSGSGSTTFAITQDLKSARELGEKFKGKFGRNNWVEAVSVR